ncbi:MAG: hypothetical protein ACPLPR_01280 [Bacillota bacterium]
MAAIERKLNEIRRLSREGENILLNALERERVKEEDARRFEKAAGSWADFDADGFVAEVYARRRGCEGALPKW